MRRDRAPLSKGARSTAKARIAAIRPTRPLRAEAHDLALRRGVARDRAAGVALAVGAQAADAQLHLGAERDARAVDMVPVELDEDRRVAADDRTFEARGGAGVDHVAH